MNFWNVFCSWLVLKKQANKWNSITKQYFIFQRRLLWARYSLTKALHFLNPFQIIRLVEALKICVRSENPSDELFLEVTKQVKILPSILYCWQAQLDIFQPVACVHGNPCSVHDYQKEQKSIRIAISQSKTHLGSRYTFAFVVNYEQTHHPSCRSLFST